MLGSWKDLHIGADLGDDALRGAPLNSGDRAEQLNGRLERGDLLPDRVGKTGDLLIQEVDMGEDRTDPDGVQMIEVNCPGFVGGVFV